MTVARQDRLIGLSRAQVRERFLEARRRTRLLFDLLDEQAYFERPIALRNPVVFYEGHIPAFAVNTLIRKALGRPGLDPHLETIFARGIDPDSEATAIARGNPAWPSRETVRQYAEAADRLILAAIDAEDLDRPGDPFLDRAEALGAILEHEEMHQETLGYIWHQLPLARKRAPSGYVTAATASPQTARLARVEIPAGQATLGTDARDVPFSWDNERGRHVVDVPAFRIDAGNVTNGQFQEFVDRGGYGDARWWTPDEGAWLATTGITHPQFWERQDGQWLYRGMFERLPLPLDWPVYVSWAEARAYARWRGARVPSEAEYHRAAFGTPSGVERSLPWQEGRVPDADGLDAVRLQGNFDFVRWDPEPVGARPEGASAFGVQDLVGNGWEWTSTVFAPFAGFTPMPSYPEYSADFFDGEHFVMKGASPLTSRFLVRPSFRNWFRPRYPYVYATFRCIENR